MSYYKLNKAYNDNILSFKENFKPTLYVFPLCGLANQLMVMFSGIVYSKNNNMNYIIIPTPYSSFNCYFTDLFNNPEINYQKNSDGIKNLNLQLYTNQKQPHIKNFGKKYSEYNIKDIKDIKSFDKDIGIIACIKFVNENNILHLYKTLKPSQHVLNQINSFYKEGNNVGIHIRHTDTDYIKYTEDEIVNIITKIYNKYKNNHSFLICGDNQSIKDRIINIMDKSKVFYQKTNLTSEINKMSKDRKHLNGMITATADLFALSYCKFLWGSNNSSSFFKTALLMGNAVEIN
tara:strand:- start:427 stop:1296 length:870 start_codon:yes stop_codon:yes gene_type:complete